MNEAHNIRDRRNAEHSRAPLKINKKGRVICKCVGVFSFFVYCLLSTVYCFSQESSKSEIFQYARKIVDTLASPSMHGRGYVKNGDKIAAKYIAEEFKKYELKKITNNYFQYFSFPINTFPNKFDLCRGPYEDILTDQMEGFMPDPSCPTIKGKFNVFRVDSSNLKSNENLILISKREFVNGILVIDTSGIKKQEQRKLFELLISTPPKGIKAIIIEKPFQKIGRENYRLSPWDLAQYQEPLPIITVSSQPPIHNTDTLTINIDAKLIPNYKSQNVIGFIRGSQYPDSFIVYTAHYDHLGQIGKNLVVGGHMKLIDQFYFPGANDNASGCAMLLNLAKYYSTHPPKYSIAFMAFGAEEAGLVGSKFYTEHPLFPLKQIKFLVNFDIMGTGDEGIKVVNATEFKTEFNTLVKLNAQGSYVKEVSPRGKASISDHYFFTQNGVKCFYIYTLGGIKAYHDIYDRAETLPLTKFEDVFHLMTDFTDWLQSTKY